MGWTFEAMIGLRLPGQRRPPGDVLGSGTAGNGGCLAELWGRRGRQDPPPLQPGDVVTLTVEGIGSLDQHRDQRPAGSGAALPPPRRRERAAAARSARTAMSTLTRLAGSIVVTGGRIGHRGGRRRGSPRERAPR